MSDMKIAHIGRELGLVLNKFAHDREPDQRKSINELCTRLAIAVRVEAEEDAAERVAAEDQHELQL
jgi:hypothetical protein